MRRIGIGFVLILLASFVLILLVGLETKRTLADLRATTLRLRASDTGAYVELSWRAGDCARLGDDLSALLDGRSLTENHRGTWRWQMGEVVPLPFRYCPHSAGFELPRGDIGNGRHLVIHDRSTSLDLDVTAFREPLVWGSLERDVVRAGDQVRVSWTPKSHFCREASVVFMREGKGRALPYAGECSPGAITFRIPPEWSGEGDLRVIAVHQATIDRCTAHDCFALPPQPRDGFSGRLRVVR